MPPLCGLEVLATTAEPDGTLVYSMGLNLNLRSLTIEQVLAARQKQCAELATMVARDLDSHVPVGDISERQSATETQRLAICAEPDANTFNDNAKFVETTEALLAQLPRAGDKLQVSHPHRRPVFALVAGRRQGSDTPVFVSGSWDGTLAEIGETGVAVAQAGGTVLSLTLLDESTDGLVVAMGFQDGSVSVDTLGSVGGPIVVHSGHGAGPATALAWLPERRWLACGTEDVVILELGPDYCCEISDPEQRWQVEQVGNGPVRGLSWATVAGRPWLVTSSLGHGQVRLWDIESLSSGGQPQLVLSRHAGGVTAVAELQGEHNLATASTDRTITVWTLPGGDMLAQAVNCHRLGVCTLVATGHAQVASGSADSTVKLWDLPKPTTNKKERGTIQNLELIATLTGHTGPVHALAFVRTEGWLASGSSDGSVRLWRAAERRSRQGDCNKEHLHFDEHDHEARHLTEPGQKQGSSLEVATTTAAGRKCGACNKTNHSSSVTCVSCGELLEGQPLIVKSVSAVTARTTTCTPTAGPVHQAPPPPAAVETMSSTMVSSTADVAPGSSTFPAQSSQLSDGLELACSECGASATSSAVTCTSCGELLL
eukprot:SAG22_NODE_510_length_9598_cov_6.080114_3_plen_600_part_00